jgi:ligand-binding SRPBCC domain-containing protein
LAVHVLERQQIVARPLQDVFEFFSQARNLEALTPPWLCFSMLTPGHIEMRSQTLIDYRLRLHGIPLRWTSRIEQWEAGRRFVDRQVRGPYRLWVHTHEFEAHREGTLVRDHIYYQLPLGPLGELAHLAFVQRDLSRIFNYRRFAVSKLIEGGATVRAAH